MWLNLARSETRQANAVLKAINAAFSDAPLSKDWFDAFALDDSEAAAAHERHVVLRYLDKKKRR